MKCYEPGCGGKTRIKFYVHTTVVGKNQVEDGTMALHTCERCDAPVITGGIWQRYEQNAAEVLLTNPKAIFDGEVIKFVRKVIGLRQVDLAKRLGCRAEQISRYEASKRPEQWLRMAMLGLLLESRFKVTPEGIQLKAS